MLLHVVKCNKYLNGEPLDQIHREPVEVIHFDELVEVHAQHLEGHYQVLAEHKVVILPDYILFVLGVALVQGVQQLRLYKPLFVKALLVL